MSAPIRNHHCLKADETVVPYTCGACDCCWLYATGRRRGTCVYGGPFVFGSEDVGDGVAGRSVPIGHVDDDVARLHPANGE